LSPVDTRSRCATQLPEGFREADEPVFHEPWQAQVFALAVSLIESGEFSWNEWAATLGTEIAAAAEHDIAEDGSAYYELWLRAVETLVTQKELAGHNELQALGAAWQQAYEQTPHGEPVVLPASAALQ
jgi:nitrile hydratase accessory protein